MKNFGLNLKLPLQMDTNGHGKTTKILQSFGEETFLILENEAKKRDIKVQELIRTVIVPEWLKKEGLR